MNNDTFAAALYGPAPEATTTPAAQPASTTPEAPEPVDSIERQEQQADALYGEETPIEIDVPEHIRELRKGDAERALYGTAQFNVAIPDNLIDNAPEAAHLSPEVRQAAVQESREMALDLGMTTADINTLKGLSPYFKEAPSAETVATWRTEAHAALVSEYGEKNVPQVLADARKLVMRDPRVTHALEQNGRGDHPKIVLMMAKLGRQARNSGRLK